MEKSKTKLLPDADGKVRPYQCQECGGRFTQLGTMRLHTRLHTGEKPHKCIDCGKKFAQRSALIVHSASHSRDRPVACNECGKTYKTKQSLTKHSLTHAKGESHRCNECPKIFKYRSALQSHLRNVHIQHTRKHKCGVCGFCARTAGTLQGHMYVHTGQRPLKFKCDQCDAAFPYYNSFKLHKIQVHTKEYPYKCEDCGQQFVTQSSKKKHLLPNGKCKYMKASVVCDVRSARCEVCDTILPKRSFEEHQQVVHGIGTKYTCGKCERVCCNVYMTSTATQESFTASQTMVIPEQITPTKTLLMGEKS